MASPTPTSSISGTVSAMSAMGGPAAAATSGSSAISNPRKFSEKIALHNQKADEEKSEFEKIMKDLKGIKKQGNGVSTNDLNLSLFSLLTTLRHSSPCL